MARSIRYQNDFIIAGAANARLSPNFKVREFQDSDGNLRVHRELAAAVQLTRDRLGSAISVDSVRPTARYRPAAPGLCLVLKSENPGGLEKTLSALKKQGYFKRYQRNRQRIYVEIHAPDNIPEIAPKTAFDCGLQVTAAYETKGDPYQQVTGNFDGAGLSFGPIQCNLGTGTLQDLFRRMRGEDEARLRACFRREENYLAFWKVLDGSRSKAVRWADALSTGRTRHGFSQPWKSSLQAVGRDPLFRDVMLRYAYDRYGKLLMAALAFLDGISPVQITNLRCLAALFDMGVQQGSLSKAHSEVRARVFVEQPTDEFTLTQIAVEERAKKASPRWRADCLSRRLGILERRPISVSLDGQRARRSNPRVYLLRNSPVSNLDDYLAG